MNNTHNDGGLKHPFSFGGPSVDVFFELMFTAKGYQYFILA